MLSPGMASHRRIEVSLPQVQLSGHAAVPRRLCSSPTAAFDRYNAGSARCMQILDGDAHFLESFSAPAP